MSPLDAVRRRFRHHAWAGSTLARALFDTPAPAALRPFAHALVADRVWHARLTGAPTAGVELWPDADAEACRALVAATSADWRAFLDGRAGLDGTASYQNSRTTSASASSAS